MFFARVGLAFLLLSGAAVAQQYTISTVAGGAPAPTPVPGVNASIGFPIGLTRDTAGNVYFSSLNVVYKLDQSGALTRVTGNSRPGYSGDGGPALDATLDTPQGLVVDRDGNIYIADLNNRRIRRVSRDGTISTFAGSDAPGQGGDGGPALNSQLAFPEGVAVDGFGNLFIADGDRIRRVSTNGIITTIAGNGTRGFSGDGGPATSAELNFPYFSAQLLAADVVGNVYVADTLNFRVRKITPIGTITTVAGNGTSGYSGDGGQATSAQFYAPIGVAVDALGNLFIADVGLGSIGNFSGGRIRKVSPNGVITTVAGGGNTGYSGDGGPAVNAALITPHDVAVDSAGNVFIADAGNNRIRKVSSSGIITTVAGNGFFNYSGEKVPAGGAQLNLPASVALDSNHNLYIADTFNSRVRKVAANGQISTVAGSGVFGYAGDGGPAANAQLTGPRGLAVDGAGNIYIADTDSNRVRKISSNGLISTIAGNGSNGYSGDGGTATAAQIAGPAGLAVDSTGNLYIADLENNRIRKVSTTGVITTVAGNGKGSATYSGDDGQATNAELWRPQAVALDGIGNLYKADTYHALVRKVSLASGVITIVAGGGPYQQLGDGGPATSAFVNYPTGVALDISGNLYIMTTVTGARVRKVTPNGTISTIAGGDFFDYGNDGGPATLGGFLCIQCGIAVDPSGNVYVADDQHNAVRLVQPTRPSLSVTNSASSVWLLSQKCDWS